MKLPFNEPKGIETMRKIGRTDANQRALVNVCRKLGVSVWVTSNVGGGGSDFVIGLRDYYGYKINILIEVKDGEKVPSKQRLTLREEEFHKNWQGDIRVIKSEEEMINLINEVRGTCY